MSVTFTKLFSSITESTVWCEPHPTRIVWIAMLAMADKRGRVFGSIPGLANRARVTVDEARTAVATFLAPDEDSRTKVDEGRRIEAIDGGWRLINHQKYRAIVDEEERRAYKAEHEARRRAKLRGQERGQNGQTCTEVGKNGHIAEAEADTLTTTTPTPSKPVACGKPEELTPQPPIRGADQSKLKSKDKTQNLTIAGTDLTFWRQQFHVIMRQVRDALYTASENLGTKGKPGMSDGYADWKMYFDDIQVAEFSADEVTAVPVLMIEAEDPNLAQQGMVKYDTRIRRAMVDVLGQEIHLRLQARNVGYHY